MAIDKDAFVFGDQGAERFFQCPQCVWIRFTPRSLPDIKRSTNLAGSICMNT